MTKSLLKEKFWSFLDRNWALLTGVCAGITLGCVLYCVMDFYATPDDTVFMILMSVAFNFLAVLIISILAFSCFGISILAYNKMKLKKPFSLPLRAFQTDTILYTWEDWRRDNQKEHPVRYFLTETVPRHLRIFKSSYITQPLYWLRTHTYNRYHVLNISGPNYKWGWIDMDSVILHASFKALVMFVEGELGGFFIESVPVDEDVEMQEYWKTRVEKEQELRALYEWWTIERPRADYDYTNEKDQHMLHRLVEIRSIMWT